MDARTAPQWVRSTQSHYESLHRVWQSVTVLGWAGFFGYMAVTLLWRNSWFWQIAAGVCFVCWAQRSFTDPDERSRRYGRAADRLAGAITRYEVDFEVTEAALRETTRRLSEELRIERLRKAPAWIRYQRRRCTLELTAWAGLFVLAVALLAVGRRWRSLWPLWGTAAAALITSWFWVPRPCRVRAARTILAEAVARYEYESGRDESLLEEGAAHVLTGTAPNPA